MQFSTLIATLALAAGISAAPQSIQPGGPIQGCTSVTTSTRPFGCTQTSPLHTATTSINCHGCVLSTTTVPFPFGGVGPVCTGGVKTVFDAEETGTVTSCKPSPTPL